MWPWILGSGSDGARKLEISTNRKGRILCSWPIRGSEFKSTAVTVLSGSDGQGHDHKAHSGSDYFRGCIMPRTGATIGLTQYCTFALCMGRDFHTYTVCDWSIVKIFALSLVVGNIYMDTLPALAKVIRVNYVDQWENLIYDKWWMTNPETNASLIPSLGPQ